MSSISRLCQLSSKVSYFHQSAFRCRALASMKSFTTNQTSKNGQWRSLSTSRCLLDILFTRKHEWVKVDKDLGTVGISNYAQEALGDIVFVQLPEVNDQIKRGEECGALESVKAASELYSPVSGIVVEKNKALEKAPAVINWSAEEDGWLFKIKLSDVKELENLMSKQNYEAYLKTQEEDGH